MDDRWAAVLYSEILQKTNEIGSHRDITITTVTATRTDQPNRPRRDRYCETYVHGAVRWAIEQSSRHTFLSACPQIRRTPECRLTLRQARFEQVLSCDMPPGVFETTCIFCYLSILDLTSIHQLRRVGVSTNRRSNTRTYRSIKSIERPAFIIPVTAFFPIQGASYGCAPNRPKYTNWSQRSNTLTRGVSQYGRSNYGRSNRSQGGNRTLCCDNDSTPLHLLPPRALLRHDRKGSTKMTSRSHQETFLGDMV